MRTPDRLQPEFTGVLSTGIPGGDLTSLQIELDGSGNYRLNVGASDLSWLIGPATDSFQHIAVTFDGLTIAVYLNGQLVQSDGWTGLGFQTLNVGIERDGSYPFAGVIDEVQVFNRALPDADVYQTFLAGPAGFCKNHAPVAVAAAAPNPAEAMGISGAAVTLDGTGSSDPDGDVLTYTWRDGATPLGTGSTLAIQLSLGSHLLTLTVDDGHRKTASFALMVEVRDTTPPALSGVPADLTLEATGPTGAMASWPEPIATDDVDGPTAVTCVPVSGTISIIGTTPVTCSSTDAHGNTASRTFTVTVADTTAPRLTLHGANPMTVEGGTSFADPGATATDTIAGNLTAEIQVTGTVNTQVVGSYTLTYTVSDGFTTTTATRRVNVVDTTAPRLTLHDANPMTVEGGTSFTDPGATATDAVAGDLTAQIHVTGTVDTRVVGSYTRTYTVSDGFTTTTMTRTVNVVDTTPPVLTVPANLTVEATSAAGAVVTFNATATDAVDGTDIVSCTPESGATFGLTTTTVTCSASDAHGNGPSRSSFTVTVRDTTGPDLVLPAQVVGEATSPLGAVVSYTANATDAVSGVVPVTCVPASTSGFAIGLTVVSCSANDAAGQISTGEFPVMVRDTTAPVVAITAPSSDATPTGATMDVQFQATDNVGVAGATVNGIAATRTSGTPQAGTWRATVPMTLPVAPGGVLRFDARASDAPGNAGLGTLLVDTDGIPKAMDRDRTSGADQSDRYSNDFNNTVTTGTVARNGWVAKLSNAPTANGVRTTISGAGSAAIVSACIGATKEVRLDAVGETADITCHPLTGTITVKAASTVNGIDVREQLTTGLWQTFNVFTPNWVSVGSPATAGADNTDPIDAQIVQIDSAGTEIVVGSYQLAPGASVDVSASLSADGSAQIRFEVLTGHATVTVSGETRTLAPGEQATLPVTGPVKATPVLTWPAPAPIVYGTALGAAQLNATSSVPGTFVYTPAAGTVLTAGIQALSVMFSPADAATDTTATASVPITVRQATPTIGWNAPGAITEPTESFFVDFSGVVNGALNQTRATITIINDDSSTQVFTSTADFAAGALGGAAYPSETSDGEIMLAPKGSEFSGTSLPAGWTSTAFAAGAAATVGNGRLLIDGAALVAPFETAAGQTLEFAATFSASPDQRVGFGTSSALGSPMAMFIVRSSDRELYVRTINGTRILESPMAGIDWRGKPHRYQIIWSAGTAQYYVDGTLMISHTAMAWGAVTMRPVISDATGGDGVLAVDWIRLTPYGGSGSYTSAVFDATAAVLWQKLTATSTVPSGTTATFTYRTGNTPTPDASWTPLTAVGAGGAVAGSSRYMQFAIQLTTTSGAKSPVIQDVTVQFKR